ncbi:hypothetical protein K437DRAFT_67782, partial [Tilletiaria anomala UBC 951]
PHHPFLSLPPQQIIQPHAHSYSGFDGIRNVRDPYDPWNFRSEDGTGDLFDEPSYPPELFQDPYATLGKLTWLSTRNSSLPLSTAVELADIHAVRALLNNPDAKTAHLNAFHPDTGEAAIHIAAATCQPDILHLLLASGVHVDTPDRQGWTPLMYLAWHSAEPLRTGRVPPSALQACAQILLDHGADPLLMSPPNPRSEIRDWRGNSIDWASLAWNHLFLRAVLPRLSGDAPLKEDLIPPPADPKIAFAPPQPPLGSRFVMASLHAFGRRTGHPRKMIISSAEPPFDNPSRAGDYSWDFSGSRLVKAVANSDGNALPLHPTNDDLAYSNIAEWEQTLDALLAGGVEVRLLEELWNTGHFIVPARVALRLLDASNVDVTQDVPFQRSQRKMANGGSLAARLVESELCSAHAETVLLLRGLKERGVDIADARLLPTPSGDFPRLQPPLRVLTQAVAERAAKEYEVQAAKDGGASADAIADGRFDTFNCVHEQSIPILALAVATLDPDMIDYLINELGVSTSPPSHFQWADFLPSPKLVPLWPMHTAFCRHLLPGRPLEDKYFAEFLRRRSATCAKLDAMGLK